MAVETQLAGTVPPMTGAEYLECISDGREIWGYGERVDDVTTHPAFRNCARMVARLYDALHDPAHRDVLTRRPTPAAGGFTHPFFRAPTHGRAAASPTATRSRSGRACLRLDGPLARLQGVLPRHAGRQRRLLRAVPGQRAALVQGARRSAACTSTTRSSTRRSTASRASTRSATSTIHVDRGDRRRPRRQRREGRRHRLGADALQLHRALRRRADQDEGVRGDLLRADERAGREAHLPRRRTSYMPPRSWAARSTTRSPAGWTRTTRS